MWRAMTKQVTEIQFNCGSDRLNAGNLAGGGPSTWGSAAALGSSPDTLGSSPGTLGSSPGTLRSVPDTLGSSPDTWDILALAHFIPAHTLSQQKRISIKMKIRCVVFCRSPLRYISYIISTGMHSCMCTITHTCSCIRKACSCDVHSYAP